MFNNAKCIGTIKIIIYDICSQIIFFHTITVNNIEFIKLSSYHFFIFIIVIPAKYFFPNETDLVAVNGSSSTGRCSNFIRSNTRKNVMTPTSSVLFDGNVPTLTGLDGDMWASQLLTINTTANTAEITFDFTDTPDYTGVGRVEVVMFNCPEWEDIS